MRVLVVSEGRHEAGGALVQLLNRLAPGAFEFEHDRLGRPDIRAHHGKGRGYLKRAIRWMIEAERNGYAGIILLVDEDGVAARRAEIAEAQETDITSIRRALGVAIRSFDAWFLADERALASALKAPIPRQPDPESIRNPKSICQALLNENQQSMSLAQFYSSLARTLDLTVLSQRCPLGFAPFADRVTALRHSASQ